MMTLLRTSAALALLSLLTAPACQQPALLGELGGTGSADEGQLEAFSVPGFAHQVDVYATTGAKRAMVILHGGGVKSWELAGALGLNAQPDPDLPVEDSIAWQWLESHDLIAVFPQGFALEATPLSFTWNNHVMDSGVDDVAFLKALSAELREEYGVTQVYLMGHSNGGMMANRVWCEAPDAFDGYIGVSGPASAHYEGGANCEPEQPRPYLGLIGDEDETLGVSETTFGNGTWQIDPQLVSVSQSAFVDPRLLGELGQHGHRSQMLCNQAGAEPDRQGEVTTYSNCSGKVQLKRVHGGGHLIFSLEEPAGFRTMEVAVDFIDGLLPGTLSG